MLVIQNITGIKNSEMIFGELLKSQPFCKKITFFHNTVIKVNHRNFGN